MNQIKDVISILESAFTNKQQISEVTVTSSKGTRQETESHEEHLESLIEISIDKLYDHIENHEQNYLDDLFKFSIVKFISKDDQVFYHLYGYPVTGDEVEFGVRPSIVEIISLLERYSQSEPDFQVIHEAVENEDNQNEEAESL